MRLSQLFTGDKRMEDTTRAPRASSASASSIARQIRSLVPGQTIHGEIVARNGSEVHIRVSDDVVLQARLDQNMNLELGKGMTFEVRNNGSALTLSPLFTNISADVTVMKAIDMAGIPLNETSVAMTSQLMEAGLSVDKSTLQQIYREIAAFPQAEVSDVVNLHKLGLPVNEENINQMIAYRNLNHQLLGGMDALMEAMPSAMEGMMAEGNLQGLAGLYQELLQMAQEAALGTEEALDPQAQAAAEAAGQNIGETPLAAAETLLEELGAAGEAQTQAALEASEEGQSQTVQDAQLLSATARESLSGQLLDALSQLPVSPEEAARLAEQLRQFAQGNLSTEEFFAGAEKMLQASRTAEGGLQNLHRIFSGDEFKTLLNGQLKNLWTLRPEEVAQPGKVEELYRRIDRQLRGLSQALENGGQTESAAFRATASLTQNVDFLNQLNQMYAYVQLPLHLSQGEAHGDLYVYANKKNLASNDGKISALLHLDMEHLGPVDVYVTLEQTKVNTRFYVQDEDMLDFLGQHMHILTERLAKRGYDCSFSMTARGADQEDNTGIAPLLRQEKGVMLSQYAFDVRT